MGISDLLALNEDTVFGQLGEAATYTPTGGTGVAITVIPVAPPEVLQLGETRLRAETDSFEVRVSELASPATGDALAFGSRSLEVKEFSYKDPRRRIWLLETRPA